MRKTKECHTTKIETDPLRIRTCSRERGHEDEYHRDLMGIWEEESQ